MQEEKKVKDDQEVEQKTFAKNEEVESHDQTELVNKEKLVVTLTSEPVAAQVEPQKLTQDTDESS